MSTIPLPYQLFFLWIEPFSTVLGTYYAWLDPKQYLELTHASSAPGILGVPTATLVVLRQLGNMYLAFALSEAFVLRATNDLKVWRTFLIVLLIADFGHLYSCYPLGVEYYYDVRNWNAAAWGNIAFVYCGATMRTCFLLGLGLGGPKKVKAKARKSIKSASEDIDIITPQLNKTPAQSTRRKKNKSTS